MEDYAVRKGADQEKTKVWFGRYNLQEIWKSAQQVLMEKGKEKIQLKILQKEERMIKKQ